MPGLRMGGRTALAVALGLLAVTLLGACSGDRENAPPAASTPSAERSGQGRTPVRLDSALRPDGMTLHYLGKDGKVKTLHVEDFPR